ncbi:MAG TPA: proline dehydrogenase family protein [Pseudolysinimonas sp.]|nr:proline dehydrogenase family protein [Pseudolysinimonas sp.]
MAASSLDAAAPARSDLPTADEVEALVHSWLSAAAARPDRQAERHARLLSDPRGLDFVARLVDGVVRPSDLRAAGTALEPLTRHIPPMLPWPVRAGFTLAGGFSTVIPAAVAPLVRRATRHAFRSVLIDAPPARRDPAISRASKRGASLAAIPVGEPVVGRRAATHRRTALLDLVARTDLDEVTVDLGSLVTPIDMWDFDETVARAVETVTPLFLAAAATRSRPRVMLDIREYRDLQLTVAVFTRVLEQPQLQLLDAGIALPAALPESAAALQALTDWARRRRQAGGAGITVRFDGAAAMPTERVDAELHGWPVATWAGREQIGTQLIRMMVHGLTPETTDSVRIVVAGHTLFDTAFAWLLAERRGVTSRLEVQLPAGTPPEVLIAVRDTVGRVAVATPVAVDGPDAAIVAFIDRLDVNAWVDTDLSAVFGLRNASVFTRERGHFAASLAALDSTLPRAHRRQDRLNAELPPAEREFRNDPISDPSLGSNREWGRAIVERSRASTLGIEGVAAARLTNEQELRARISRASAAGAELGTVNAAARADLLHRIGDVVSVMRGRFVEVLLAETHLTLAEADAEVSRAIDLAHHSARLIAHLADIDDAAFTPDRLTVIVPTGSAALSDAAGGIFTALAVGSAAILVPAPQAERVAVVLREALHEAGVPDDACDILVFDARSADRDRLLVELLHAPEVSRTTLGRRAGAVPVIVTPSADIAQTVECVVQSATAHGGRADAAVSAVILVGSMASSEALRGQLSDALTSVGRDDSALDLVTAATLDDAIILQKQLGGGLVAGLFSHDSREVQHWLDTATASTLVVNRPTITSVVRRQPTGPGPAPMSGGPHALLGHGTWRPLDAPPSGDLGLGGVDARVAVLIEACQPALDYAAFDSVRRGALSDARAWARDFAAREVAALTLERNVLRYQAAEVVVRLAAGAELTDLVRVLTAGVRTGARLLVSSAIPLPSGVLTLATQRHALQDSVLRIDRVDVESDDSFHARMAEDRPERIRLIAIEGTAGDAAHLDAALRRAGAVATVWAGPVTSAGRIELLPFVHEQAVSIAAHRRGRPDRSMRKLMFDVPGR